MNAQKQRSTGKLFAAGLIALAIAGTTAGTAQADSYTKTYSSPRERTVAQAQSWYPNLRDDCRSTHGVVIREYIHDYANENPRTFKAFVLCQVEIDG